MRNIVSITAVMLLLLSCGGKQQDAKIEKIIESGDLAQIRAKKAELDKAKAELSGKIKKLELKIKQLDPQEKIPLITTFTAKEDVFNHYLELQGSVATKKNLIVTPEFSGILSAIYVRKGQYVKKGQHLAKVDDAGLSQQLAQLEIQAALAKTTFERQDRLWKQKIGSEIQYLQAKSNYEAQQRAIEQLKQQLSKTIIKSPFYGTVDDIITEKGTVVAAGQSPIFRIVNLNNMYIEADVPESYLKNVTRGKSVKVEFPTLGKTVDAKIKQTSNFIDPANRTYKIEIDVPNRDKMIKPNLTARLKINDYTSKKAVLIPQNIISENAEGQQYVYTIVNKAKEKGKAKRVIIETGKTQGDFIEVLNGLKSGDEIIQEGARSVQENQKVRILNS